jgi:hypothetical protein
VEINLSLAGQESYRRLMPPTRKLLRRTAAHAMRGGRNTNACPGGNTSFTECMSSQSRFRYSTNGHHVSRLSILNISQLFGQFCSKSISETTFFFKQESYTTNSKAMQNIASPMLDSQLEAKAAK